MIDLQVLAAFGTSDHTIRRVMTAVAEDPGKPKPKSESKEEKKERLERGRQNERDVEFRKRIEQMIQSRLYEGIGERLKTWRFYASCDLARDTPIVSKTKLSLSQFAMGKINVETCAKLLSQCADGRQYIKTDEETKTVSVDVPRFVEMSFNLVRSVVLRRWTAQKNIFNEPWPYFYYEPRSTGLVAKLRADVLSQRVDMMADQFGYRHHDSQVMLDAFYYGHAVDFVRCGWEIDKQWRRKTFDGGAKDIEAVITRQGVGWFNPHPSRVFWDNNHPLASINSDSGCEWLGFWDIMRYSDIVDNPAYYNNKEVGLNGMYWGASGIFNGYLDYFDQYEYVIKAPAISSVNPALENDRKANVGNYSGRQKDSSVLYSNFYWKMTPKDWGLGDYPWPVWLRLVVASDCTVIFGEVLPSAPATYLGINESDGRQSNPSMASDLMPYQDAMTNLLTKLLILCQIESFKAIGINKDGPDEKSLKFMEAQLRSEEFYADPLVYFFSRSKTVDPETGVGIKADDIIKISEAKTGQSISVIFESIIKLVALVERLMALSPAEQGQPASHEISATESNLINVTTSSVYSSISDDIRESRAPKKKIIFESISACHEGEIMCPVKDRYTKKTVEQAGFKLIETETEDFKGTAQRQTVIGTRQNLVHDYYFTSRDTPERRVNTQAANTLVQQFGLMINTPALVQSRGFKEKVYAIANEIFRLSGSGLDVIFELQEGEEPSFSGGEIEELKQFAQQMATMMQQLGGAVEKNSTDLQSQEQLNAQQAEQLKAFQEMVSKLAKHVETNTQDVDEIRLSRAETDRLLIESIDYKNAPPSVRAQLEARAGLVPAPLAERTESNGESKTTTTKRT